MKLSRSLASVLARIAGVSAFTALALAGCSATVAADAPSEAQAQSESSCLFGDMFSIEGDLPGLVARLGRHVQVLDQTDLDRTSLARMGEVTKRQLVRAMHASSHTDVRTAEEAFERADGGIIERYTLSDTKGARSYTAIIYGAGDNTYGAIFERGTDTVAALVQDSDFHECKPKPENCIFGSTDEEMHASSYLEKVSELDSRNEITLTGEQEALLLAGIRVHRPEAATLAEALQAVDEGAAMLTIFRQKSTGREFASVEYALGDNSYGAVLDKATKATVAVIGDAEVDRCAVHESAPRTRGVTYRKVTLDARIKATARDCAALEPRTEGAFYCPKVDKYKFSGPVDGVAWQRLLERRSVDGTTTSVSIDQAVAALRSRAQGDFSEVSQPAVRAEIKAIMDAYEGHLRNAPGTRIVIGSGYWAPSVNSDTVFVIDDNDHTVLAFEHGDTDG
jgi:hypothetical protein